MTTLRKAAQQALEALESAVEYDYHGTPLTETHAGFNDAATALKAALAEPVQEPVAWIQPNHLQKARRAPFLCRVEPTKRMVDFVALYTAPPQRKPLTQEELRRLGGAAFGIDITLDGNLTAFARAVERAHGIT